MFAHIKEGMPCFLGMSFPSPCTHFYMFWSITEAPNFRVHGDGFVGGAAPDDALMAE